MRVWGVCLSRNSGRASNSSPRRPDDDWQRAQAQEKLAWALSVYDLPRALQWLESVEDNRGENSHKDTTRIAILAAAFATPEQRAFVVAANPSGY